MSAAPVEVEVEVGAVGQRALRNIAGAGHAATDVGDGVRFGRDLPNASRLTDRARPVSRYRLRITTLPSPRCPLDLQIPGGYLLHPGTTTDEIVVYGDEVGAIKALVSTPEDDARWAEAERAFERDLMHEDVRAELAKIEDGEHWMRAPLAEIVAAVSNAGPDSPITKAAAKARVTTNKSVAAQHHQLFALAEGHGFKSLASCEVLENLGPPTAKQTRGADGSDATAALLERFQKMMADQQAAHARTIEQLLERLAVNNKKEGK